MKNSWSKKHVFKTVKTCADFLLIKLNFSGEETTEAAGKKRSKSMEKPKSETTTPTSNVAKKRSASSALKAHISAKRRELKDGEAATPEDKAKEGLTPSKPIGE